MTLENIGKKYCTTKWPHGFLSIYEQYFELVRNAQISLLEIGIAEGNSLRMWREYFTKATITGIDKHIQETFIDGCDQIQGDATKGVEGSFDIIIDDGSHIAQEQLESFESLLPNLNPGGWYVIEDLFTLYDKTWNPSAKNIIELINSRMKNILIGGDAIQEVHFYGRNDINGILFLRKRYEEFRIQPLSEFQNL